MKVVIMAGGKGTRFWPRSVESKPKQFLALTSNETMLQLTYARFLAWLPERSIYVVTSEEYASLVLEQLPNLNPAQVILEPAQRDTGPCMALTALHFLGRGDDEVLVTTPSDQYIPEMQLLQEALLRAEGAASMGKVIVTLGIVPTRPETGYGYIKAEPAQDLGQILKVEAFVEKPSLEKAHQYLEEGNMYWNSGIFIWKPSTIAHNMKAHQPLMWSALTNPQESLALVYPQLQKISVDYAIMEKASELYTIPVTFDWDDIGSWTSLERMHRLDAHGNLLLGTIHSMGCSNNIISTEHQKTIVIGVENLIIVSTSEGLLVCHKSNEQDIKTALKLLDLNSYFVQT